MRLSNKIIVICLNILLGAAWAATIYLFIHGFLIYGNFFLKLFNAITQTLYGIFAILAVELMFRAFENSYRLKRLEQELKELKEKLEKK